MIVGFTLILTICADMAHCRKVPYGWFSSESACRSAASLHREAVRYQCVVTMREKD